MTAGRQRDSPIAKELIVRFIPDSDAEALRTHLDTKLEGPVTLDLFIEPRSAILVPGRPECEFCEETRALLEDVAALSDQITLKIHDVRTESDLARDMGVSRVPTLVFSGAARGVVRYLGIPAGLEFGTLLEDLAAVSRGTTTLGSDSRTKLATLGKPVHVQVFVTPTCPYCPTVARLAHQAAVENENVIADVVEVSEFPDLAAQYHVRGVPKVVMNDTLELVGAQQEAAFVEALLEAAA
jgi:glutaredoxin-like protein